MVAIGGHLFYDLFLQLATLDPLVSISTKANGEGFKSELFLCRILEQSKVQHQLSTNLLRSHLSVCVCIPFLVIGQSDTDLGSASPMFNWYL